MDRVEPNDIMGNPTIFDIYIFYVIVFCCARLGMQFSETINIWKIKQGIIQNTFQKLMLSIDVL